MPAAKKDEAHARSRAAAWSERAPLAEVVSGALVVLLAGAFYFRFFQEDGPPFVFDDVPGVVQNPNIEHLWPLSRSLGAPPGTGASGRPLVALSLALNYALGGRSIRGYLLLDLGVHLAAALVLFALVRRALLHARERDRPAPPATLAAALLAFVWAAHPLHTMALANVVYRNEALVGLFYLATLWCSLEGMLARRPLPWYLLAALAGICGAASKEVIVSAPIAVLLLDRALVSPSFRAALRAHGKLYALLALSWVALACCVSLGDRGESVGVGIEAVTPLDYLRTQAGVILHYLRLVFWPHPLVLDYDDWPIARTWGAVVPEGLAVLALLCISTFGALRGRVWGFLGALCFLVLAPSSSVIPLTGAIVGEHRTYLCVAALALLAAWPLAAALQRTRVAAAALTVVGLGAGGALGLATSARVDDYYTGVSIWEDVVRKRPGNAKAWSSLGTVYNAEGRLAEAEEAYRRAMALNSRYHEAHVNLGNLLLNTNRIAEANEAYARALALRSDVSEPHYYYGSTAVALGRAAEGVEHLRRALDLGLDARLVPSALQQIVWVLSTSSDDALRDGPAALRLARELDRMTKSSNAVFLDALAVAFAENGRFEDAIETTHRALRLLDFTGNRGAFDTIEQRLGAYAERRPWRQ